MAQNGLSPRQRRAIRALLVEKNIKAAAKVAKVGHRTLTRWLTQPDFLLELRQAEAGALDEASRLLVREAGPAVEALATIRDNALNSAASRVSAARAILDNTIRLRELAAVEERLRALEAMTDETD